MSAAVAQFDGQVSQISGVVSSIVGASWTGEAADEFAQSWADWQTSASAVRTALTDIVARLQGAESTYVSTEMQVAAASRGSTVSARRSGGSA